ncbi:hypothetical protein MTR_0020s0050 [Medicago truncatula]|uniref:Uncharacterized protein n=1 Tax=Medicago truncatula TaxID=3880 RepID=A0A072TIK3_MEDTR|nr:hypothetical protein MTR_0020s0050 [Medicago truncatula]
MARLGTKNEVYLSAEFFTEKSETDQGQTTRVSGVLGQKLGHVTCHMHSTTFHHHHSMSIHEFPHFNSERKSKVAETRPVRLSDHLVRLSEQVPVAYSKCNIPDCFQNSRLTPQTNTSLFSMFCPHSHAYRETSRYVTHPKIAPSQARLTVEFLWNELPKRRCILLILVVSNNSYKPSFNHAVPYLYGLRIPLIPM